MKATATPSRTPQRLFRHASNASDASYYPPSDVTSYESDSDTEVEIIRTPRNRSSSSSPLEEGEVEELRAFAAHVGAQTDSPDRQNRNRPPVNYNEDSIADNFASALMIMWRMPNGESEPRGSQSGARGRYHSITSAQDGAIVGDGHKGPIPGFMAQLAAGGVSTPSSSRETTPALTDSSSNQMPTSSAGRARSLSQGLEDWNSIGGAPNDNERCFGGVIPEPANATSASTADTIKFNSFTFVHVKKQALRLLAATWWASVSTYDTACTSCDKSSHWLVSNEERIASAMYDWMRLLVLFTATIIRLLPPFNVGAASTALVRLLFVASSQIPRAVDIAFCLVTTFSIAFVVFAARRVFN